MKNCILNELISTMRERIPQDMNLANTLADILCMGKEAVYRRLRGEVSFTIDEVALLSQKLGISIDQIVGSHVSNKVTFDLNLLHASSALESYYEIINRYLQIFDYVKTDNTTEVYTASNSLPFTLYSSYENLSKFRLCRWMYQNGDIKTPHSLEEMSVDERIVNVHKKLSESIRQCPKTFFIWDTNIFYSFCERDQVLCQSESDKQGRCHAFEGRASSVTWRGRTSVHKRRVQRKQESIFLSVQYQFRSHLQLYRET